MDPNGLILLYIYIFYSRYNMEWIGNTEIVLEPNNSVIKRLRCMRNLQIEQPHEKTNNMCRQKQSRRSAVQ